VACTRVFEVMHGLKKGEGLGKDAESVSHPNKYSDASRELERSVRRTRKHPPS
jgi:DNA primase large subunit